jgi:hypothetical protein
MSLKRAIVQGFRTLYNPKKEFEELNSRSFEELAEDYILLLLAAGVVAGVMSLAYRIIYAAYLTIAKGMNIDYWRLLNYTAGNSISMFFFYLFAGTFLLFIITMILRIFVRGIKLTKMLSVMLYAITPMLFFGWVAPAMFLPLIIWSLFLLWAGVKALRQFQEESNKAAAKNSVRQKRKATR